MDENGTTLTQMICSPKGIFEVIMNGLWPSEEDIEQAEREMNARRVDSESRSVA